MKVIKPALVPSVSSAGTTFTGPVTRQSLLEGGAKKYFDANMVNFGRGVRNKFHTHSADQLLIVTSGTGNVATDDQQSKVDVGDVIYIPAGEKHWHGAAEGSEFSHISIMGAGGQTKWLEE